jgi:alanine-synthesizing transaminase
VFSRRALPSLELNEIALGRAKLRTEGRPLVDLTTSNPTLVGLGCISELLTPLAHPRGLAHTPEPLGAPLARQAVADWYRAAGYDVAPSRVILTASTSESYSILFKLLADPGDAVLVPTPSYPLFEHLARLDGVLVEPYPLRLEGRWEVDMDALERARSVRTRGVVVVNPNNPTGSFLTRRELDRIVELGLPLISDEVFAEFDLSRPKDAARVLTLSSGLGFVLGGVSKSLGLPQLKLGWIVVCGDSERVAEALSCLELILDTYLSVSTPTMLALPQLFSLAAPRHAALRARVRQNAQRLEELVTDTPVSLLPLEGGWSAVLRLPRIESETEWVLRFMEEGLLVQPGWFYDFGEEAFTVVSLLPEPELFELGLSRLLSSVARACAGGS